MGKGPALRRINALCHNGGSIRHGNPSVHPITPGGMPAMTPLTLEDRVTILETRFDTILPTLATKEDVVRLAERMDAMGNRLLLRFGGIALAIGALAVAAAKYL